MTLTRTLLAGVLLVVLLAALLHAQEESAPPAESPPAPSPSSSPPAPAARPAVSAPPPAESRSGSNPEESARKKTAPVPRPRTAAELAAHMEAMTAALDFNSLWAMCRDLKPNAFPEEPGSGLHVRLCRGRALQGRGEREEARREYAEVIQQAAGVEAGAVVAAERAASEARYRLAELAEADYRDYPLCVREFGITWASRAEAREKLARLRAAERAYQDALSLSQPPWRSRAAFRIAALLLAFYQEVSEHSAPTFRGLKGPPPLASARVDVADQALGLLLHPATALWPRALVDGLTAAARRAEADGDDPELVTSTKALLDQVRSLPPPPLAPVAAPWPQRRGDTRGWRSLEADRDEIVFETGEGRWVREPVATAGRTLVDVVRGAEKERFAPEAAVALGVSGYRLGIPALVAAAKGSDHELAVAAVFALGELGGITEVPLLLELFRGAVHPGDMPEPFETPAAALFGTRERVLEALSKIGRRDPRAVAAALQNGALPRREVSYVLWGVAHRDLVPFYRDLLRDQDPWTALYGLLGLAVTSAKDAWSAASDLASQRAALCWMVHLRDLLKREGAPVHGGTVK